MWRRIEGPTWVIAAAIYGGWGLLIWYHALLPLWLICPLGAWLIAWHGSLQHETVHGHPTRHRWLNTLLAWPPLGLWMPYMAYRDLHLRHHATPELASPAADPESFYLTRAEWRGCGALMRRLLTWNNSLAGRLALGPAISVGRYWAGELRRLARSDRRNARLLAGHLAAVGAVLFFVGGVAGMALPVYVLLIVYPGVALTQLRSFLEHRPAPHQDERTVIVEAGALTSLLFLNNNLHAAHHANPGLPWYALPAHYRQHSEQYVARNGGYRFDGYGDVARRHLLRPKDLPVQDPIAAGA